MANGPKSQENPRLKGDGTLAVDDDAWTRLLSDLGRDRMDENAFTARNFLLDEGVLPERLESYRDAGCVAGHGSFEDWQTLHRKYLARHVDLPADDGGPPTRLDPGAAGECPETFRLIDPESPFLGTDPNVMLVRVEEVDFVADCIGESRAKLMALARGALEEGAENRQRLESTLNGLLEDWFVSLRQRPVFSGFWADVGDLLEDDHGNADWPNHLRDRLGLAHLDPDLRKKPIDVMVFRYPVRAVPRLKGTRDGQRPLVTPTVLDGAFSEAFCPSPRGSTTGHVVHLNPESGKLRREVLHPRFQLRASHLWRLGTVTRGVKREQLIEGRSVHLLLLRDELERQDYAEGTDWDLFQ